MSLRILLDMDAILTDLLAKWLRIQNHTNGTTVTKADVTTWDFLDEDILFLPRFFDDLEPLPGAIEGVTELVAAGHDVLIATSPCSADCARAKIEWVEHHFGFLGWGYRKMAIINQKHRLTGDVLIDDSPAKLKNWLDENPGESGATIAYPYNETARGDRRIRFCGSYQDTRDAWNEILRYIGHIAASKTRRGRHS